MGQTRDEGQRAEANRALLEKIAREMLRRREEAETEQKEKMRLRVVRRMIETRLTLDQVGEVIDERGVVWGYCIAVPGLGTEFAGEGRPSILIEEWRGPFDRFHRYCEAINQRFVLSEEQKEIILNGIVKAILLSDGEQFGIEAHDVV